MLNVFLLEAVGKKLNAMRKKKINSKIPYSLELQSQRFLSALHARNRTRRITALVMAAVILFTSLFTTVAISESNVLLALDGPSAGVSDRVADDDTMDTYRDRLISKEAGSRYAGRLWADKSVFKNGSSVTLDMKTDGYNGAVSSNADFLHAFSALGSSQMVSTGESIPIDVVFVLDFSKSMGGGIVAGKDNFRIKRTVNAVNDAINTMLSLNSYSRVSIAVYSEIGYVYVPLVNFVPENNAKDTEWLVVEDSGWTFEFTVRVHGNARVADPNGKDPADGDDYEEGWSKIHPIEYYCEYTGITSEAGWANKTTKFIGIVTNIQAGIAAGMNVLAEEPVTTWKSPMSGSEYDRIPIVMIMTDGESNRLCRSEDGSDANAWYNTNIATTINTTNDENLDGIAPIIQSTLMTAAYNMVRIDKNYAETPLAYGVGIDIGSATTAKQKIYASLDPGKYFNNGDHTDILKADDGSTVADDRIKTAYSNYQNWLNSNSTVTAGYLNNGTVKIDISQLPNDDKYNITKQDIADHINFTDAFYNKASTEIDDVFSNIIKDISEQGQAFPPLNGSNGAGVEDALTYADPIGEYMEIKDGAIVHGDNPDDNPVDMSMLLLGEMYDLEKNGIYDYNFNDEYKKYHPTEYPNYPAEYTVLKDGWYSSDDPEQARYLGDSDEYSWEDGYFRYVSYETAIDYVPTLAELTDSNGDGKVNGFDATPKQQNTVYTFYRIVDADEIGDVWRFNPAYEGRIPELKATDYDENYVLNGALQNEYTELVQSGQSVPSGVYRLNDIRIWVEDTGDFKDKYPDDSLFVGMGYDQALFVNVPAGALPIQVAEILLDDEGVASYVTNLGADHEGANQAFYYRQSTPLRVFYSVGLQKKIVTEDGVDLTKVSQTYLDSHRNEDNSIYFLSNYFTGDGNEGYKAQGDPVITFSPGINNRFYVFQKTLAFYTKAYRWNGTGFDEVTEITSWEGGELKGVFETVEEVDTKGYVNGDIIFLSGDVANTKIESDGTYFWTFECYVSDGLEARAQVREGATGGRTVNYVLARKGSEFIAEGFDNLNDHDMINWYDIETGATQPYNDGNKPDAEGTWVLATHVGGLRLSELASFAKNDNTTQTAEYYYTPAVSGSSGSGADVLINAYLGNNGRVTIEDTMLLVTKLVELRANSSVTESQRRNEEFIYQIYIEDFTGIRGAIRVVWDEQARIWRRRISTIDVLTSNESLLQNESHELIKVDENGAQAPDGGYYVYVPSTGEDDSSDLVSRIFSAGENGEIVNGSARRNADNSIDFLADIVYLIPVDQVTDGWSFPENNAASFKKIENSFVIATMEAADAYGRDSGNGLVSDFAIRSQYLMVDLVFGVNYEAQDGEDLTGVDFAAPTELYDKTTFNGGGQNDEVINLETIAAHTAQFTLKHGEGLLFNGIKSGGDYRVTEKLTNAQANAGWCLWKDNEKVTQQNFNDTLKVAVRHVQQNSYINYDDSGEPTDVWSNAGGGTIWQKQNGKFVSPSGENLHNTTHFNTKEHAYSVFGDTALQEEAVQYVNTVISASMDLSKVVEGEPDENDVYTFNIEYYTKGENGDEIPLPDGTYHAYIHETDHVCTVENHPHVEGEASGNCENDLILTDGKGSVVLKDGEIYVICGLPQGAYYKITESIDIQDGAIYDYVTGFDITDDTGSRHVNGLTAEGRLNTADENDIVKVVRVAYTNRAVIPEPGDLTVSKTVGGFGTTGKSKEWNFTVTLKPLDPERFDTTYQFEGGVLDGVTGVTPPENGELTFTKQENGTYTTQISLKHGQTITIKDLPYGTVYSVSEDEAGQGGYTTAVTGDQNGTINIDREVGFVNTPYGSLEVEKEVVGVDPDDKEFNFTVTLKGEGLDPKKLVVSGNSEITWSTGEDGSLKGSFTLSNGQSIKISNIPADVEYKVEEEKLKDYTVKKEGNEGTITVGNIATAHFINAWAFELPELGGIGTLPFQLLGTALITIALLCVILMKKRYAKTTKS